MDCFNYKIVSGCVCNKHSQEIFCKICLLSVTAFRLGSLPSSVVVIVLCVRMCVYMLTTHTVVAMHYYPIKAYKISIAIVDCN